jgi:hypothetical protein
VALHAARHAPRIGTDEADAHGASVRRYSPWPFPLSLILAWP